MSAPAASAGSTSPRPPRAGRVVVGQDAVGGDPEGSRPLENATAFEPVRLVAARRRSAFVPGREAVLARLEGDALAALDLRDGDHVVLVQRESAEHGDVAAVIDDRGQATLWKVYPEPGLLRLVTGRPGQERRVSPAPRIQGVVVAVLREPR